MVGECLWEDFKASQIEEAQEDSSQTGCQISVCLRKSRSMCSRELGWLAPLLHEAK